jgi:hypothetical protein
LEDVAVHLMDHEDIPKEIVSPSTNKRASMFTSLLAGVVNLLSNQPRSMAEMDQLCKKGTIF